MPETRTADLRKFVYKDIEARCAANVERWGDERTLTELLWHAVLAEEMGEVSEAILNTDPNGTLRGELIDLAAVAVAMVEAIDDERMAGLAFTPGHPLAIVMEIGQKFGHVARAILERCEAGTVRLEIVEMISSLSIILGDTYRLGLEPRDFEGEDDQESKSAGADLTWTGVSSVDTSGAPDRISHISDFLTTKDAAQAPSAEGHEWHKQSDPDTHPNALTTNYLCPHCSTIKAVADPAMMQGWIIKIESVWYRPLAGNNWSVIEPPCAPGRQPEKPITFKKITILEETRGTVDEHDLSGLDARCCTRPHALNVNTAVLTNVHFDHGGVPLIVQGSNWICEECGAEWFTGPDRRAFRGRDLPPGVMIETRDRV